MIAEFYDREVEYTNHKNQRVTEDHVYFRLVKPSIAGGNAVPFEFDGEATPEHRKGYPKAWKAYLDKKAAAAGVASEMTEASGGLVPAGDLAATPKESKPEDPVSPPPSDPVPAGEDGKSTPRTRRKSSK